MKKSSPGEKYVMKLFVAEGEVNSHKARQNLTSICQKYLPDNHELIVIDVLADFEKALENKIFITPTLILMEPQPQVTLFGNLADTQKILAAFRLNNRDV